MGRWEIITKSVPCIIEWVWFPQSGIVAASTVRISFGEVPASATLPHFSTAQSQGAGKVTDGDHRLPCTLTSLARRGPKKGGVRGLAGWGAKRHEIVLLLLLTVFPRGQGQMP